jgi:type III secretory pathway component EscV
MTDNSRVLPVTVALTSPLFAIAVSAATPVRRRIEAELSELLNDLGVARRPAVDIRESDSSPTTSDIGLFVDGRRCRFPVAIIADAFAYVEGTPQVAMDPAALRNYPQVPGALSHEHVAELAASVCRAAISAQPTIVTNTDDSALNAALDLGMSIANGDHVMEGHSSNNDDLVEQRIAAQAAKTIDIHIDPLYFKMLSAGGAAEDLFRFLRESLFQELGLPLPPFHLYPDPSLKRDAFAFRINSVRTLPRIGLPAGTILVNDVPERLALLDIDADPTLNPSTRQPAAITSQEHKDSLEALGRTTWNPFGFLILTFAAALRRGAHALMSRNVAANMTQQLEKVYPFLVQAAETHVPPDLLAPVLRELLLDGVPIRNLRRIMELLLRYETIGAPDPFLDRITFVRSGLADVIAHKFARGNTTVVAYLLDPEIENALGDHKNCLHPDSHEEPLAERLAAALRAELSRLARDAQIPVILTRDELRRPLRALLRHDFPQMVFLAYGDLPPTYNVEAVARISWA